ncbi:DUF4099 domain-containing protein [Sphingobacterium shayense]|uniref:DUF4099 domain-containing protein n=1 Tax=Sphingobacterium shayense TaxID=626343 RepID=UPI001557494B|nr:DUF4099 domain-containing protein [Sphingobacterium shayense]NQD72556.1 DUF4099 domain-containing protein [Sphingobacterium shayense]
MKKQNNPRELPVRDLEKLGLYANGGIALSADNVDALYAGRRTDMLDLTDIELGGLKFRHLNVKLSVLRKSSGEVILQLHPIYKGPQLHPLLSEKQTQQLISGEQNVIAIDAVITDKKTKRVLIAYDPHVKEFVTLDPSKVEVPLMVNGFLLSAYQKDDFRNGKVVHLENGIDIQYSATESKGILSNSKRLMLTAERDGHTVNIAYRGLENIHGSILGQTEGFSKNYNELVTKSIISDKNLHESEASIRENSRNNLDETRYDPDVSY